MKPEPADRIPLGEFVQIASNGEDWGFIVEEHRTRVINEDGEDAFRIPFRVGFFSTVEAAIVGYRAGMKAGTEGGKAAAQADIRKALGITQ